MNQKLLITGSSGFIGTNLVRAAVQTGYDVLGIDTRSPTDDPTGYKFKRLDILDQVGLKETVQKFKPTSVVHLAARTDLSEDGGSESYNPNVQGVRNMASVLSTSEAVQRIIWASSRLVFAIDHRPVSIDDFRPSTQYGVSKVEGEHIVVGALDKLPHSFIVRPTSIWGPHFGEPYLPFFNAVLQGRYVHPGRERPLKTFGYVENTTYQILELLADNPPASTGAKFMLGDYTPLDLREWAQYIATSAGRGRIRQVPLSLLRAAALVGDGLQSHGKKSPLTSFRLNNLVTDMQYDTQPLEKMAPNLPYTWQEGVDRTLSWLGVRHLNRRVY